MWWGCNWDAFQGLEVNCMDFKEVEKGMGKACVGGYNTGRVTLCLGNSMGQMRLPSPSAAVLQ